MITNTYQQVAYRVHPKESIYFAIKIFFSIILYYLLIVLIVKAFNDDDIKKRAYSIVVLFYGVLIMISIALSLLLLVGHLKGNAVKVSAKQFPDIYNIVIKQAQLLGMPGVPDIYILQSGGVLNAFVTRFFGTNYLVIYSDILAAAYEQNMKVVEFVIGHEMGHIKRKHILKRFLLLPAAFIPFLGAAYSRACEYTCDSIGHALCPEGAKSGMLLLAAGRGLFTRVNSQAFIEQIYTEESFSRWLAEKFASHPNLNKRIAAFPASTPDNREPVVAVKAEKPDDYSRFLPK